MIIDPVRPARPRQVTVAVRLQLAVVALLLGAIGLLITFGVHFDHRISETAAQFPGVDPRDVAGERSDNRFGVLVIGVLLLIPAIWFAATLPAVRRGSNVGRILVFVGGGGILLLGFSQLCGGLPLGLIGLVLDGNGSVSADDGQSFSETLYGRPDHFGEAIAIGGGLAGLALFGLLVAVVLLLALPPAHRYFVPRAEPPAGLPMVPWPYMICPDPSAHFPAARAGVSPEPDSGPPPAPRSSQ